MVAHTFTGAPPAATHLLAATVGEIEGYDAQTGVCCFCETEGRGLHVDEATSPKYFSDDPLLNMPSSDHVCQACAWAMDQRRFKQGHWLTHVNGVECPSTGDLLGTFRSLQAGAFDPPLAAHITSSPIRSSHAYLWTPVNETLSPLSMAYDRQTIRIADWSAFERLLVAVEDLRLAGFTFDEIRSGEPRVRNLRQLGRDRFRERDTVIDPHRRTAGLELALTLSRGGDDQPRDGVDTDHHPLTP